MPRTPLDRDRILEVALALADESGLPAVTARNLADRLEVTPMALYRHVPNLAAVVDGLLERALTSARILDHASPTLEGFLLETFERIHDCLVAHPSVLPLLGTPAGYGPSAIAVADAALARFAAAGYTKPDAVRAFHLLLAYTLGAASLRAAMRSRVGPPPRGAFDDAPYVRDALPSLGRFGSDRTFRGGFAALLGTLAPPDAIRSTSRRRPTSRRAI